MDNGTPLQELGTEGQGTTSFQNRKPYSLTQLSIPFGGGVKIGVSDDFNIIIEYGLRKTFTDYIDDVSTTYAGIPSEFDNITIELSDRSLDKMITGPKDGIARGDETNKDWYSLLELLYLSDLKEILKVVTTKEGK